MSFILDALRKSENDRQRQLGPSFADVPVRRVSNERPWWIVVVAGLLVVNLGVLIAVLTRGSAGQPAAANPQPVREPLTQSPSNVQPAGTPQAAPPAVTTPPPVNIAPSMVQQPQRQYGPTPEPQPQPYDMSMPPGVNPALAAAASVPEGEPVVRRIEPATMPQDTAPVPEDYASQGPEILPTIDDVTASGVSLPELHIDIHVYSSVPKDRFVFINMRKYTEGEKLTEGPVLERITADGAILAYAGRRFLLPRR